MKSEINTGRIRLYFWLTLAYFVIGSLSMADDYPGKFILVIVNNFWAVIYVAVLNFILFEISVPWVLKRRKVFVYNILAGILLAFVHLILYSYGAYSWRFLGMQLHIYTELIKHASTGKALEMHMMYSMASFFLFGIVRHIYGYIKLKQAAQQLKFEMQAAELNYLRSQTNPHFLFNTLNNIYSLARDKSDLTPESILRLSKILRFILYETGGKSITIGQELKVIGDYIALEKLRYDDSLRVDIEYDVENMEQAIPPLLMIPLVENSFKHGVSETRNHPFVEISLSVKDQSLEFIVENSVDQSENEGSGNEKIGLANLRRQLALLYKDYDLSIQHSDSVFIAALKINLRSHV